MWRDLVTVAAVVALFAVAGWLLPRCSLDLTRPVPATTTTDYRQTAPEKCAKSVREVCTRWLSLDLTGPVMAGHGP